MTAQQQLLHYRELLLQEQAADLAQYRAKVNQKTLKERVAEGMSWYPIRLKNLRVGMGEQLIMELERDPVEDGGTGSFQVGSVVAVFGQQDGSEAGRVTGVVAALSKTYMRVALSLKYLPDWLPPSTLGVHLEFDDKTYRDMFAALDRVMDPKKNERLAELREILLGEKKAEFYRWEIQYRHLALNASQNQAVQRALEAKDVAIIHGPPGTGKTTTLVQAIGEILRKEHQVLVCAASNTAVDLLAHRCGLEGLGVLRLGNPARIDDELEKYTLDYRITEHPDYPFLRKLRQEAEEARRQAGKFKRNFGSAERQRRGRLFKEAREMRAEAKQLEHHIIQQLLSHSQVIACTLTGAAMPLLGRKRFHTVFIDEAGQALLPACWIPILRADRVIMAGDHRQLPPTVKSREADQQGLGITLFEKLMDRPELSVMLNEQYRMHEQIMRFSSQQFYQDQLQANFLVCDHLLGPDFPPVEFVDTAGCGFREFREPKTLSTGNAEEAQLLLRHLAMLFGKIEREAPQLLELPFSVGVISPYKAQIRTLTEQLKNSPMLSSFIDYIGINTVDGFQGQERDVIYISLVRSNERGDIGFLKDIRRMNVALTRARKKLVVVGDSATLGKHAFYQAFLDYIDEIGAYRSAWEFME